MLRTPQRTAAEALDRAYDGVISVIRSAVI